MSRKLVIEIEVPSAKNGEGVYLIHALAEMIKEITEDEGPLYKQHGTVYTLYYGEKNDDGEELLNVNWKWVGD